MKKDAYYFSHDANAQDDPKCMLLIDQLGMEGYGIFWALIEKLRGEKDYKLPMIITGSYAKRWSTSKEKIDAVIKTYGLFEIENDMFFFSKRLSRSMEEKSEKARLSVQQRWKNTNVLQSNTTEIRTDTIKVKESKGKNKEINKEKISRINTTARTLRDMVVDETGKYPPEMIEKFLNYWEEKSPGGIKQRWQMEKVFDPKKRLATWYSRSISNPAKTDTTLPEKSPPYWQSKEQAMAKLKEREEFLARINAKQ